MNKPLVSIIIPVYNVQDFLEQCLDSVYKQTYTNFEAIVINDGSTDNSEKTIDKFLKDKRFIKINKPNGGLSSARNVGLDIARGDYITFIDSDDFVSPNYLLEMINSIGDADMCVSDYFEYGPWEIYRHPLIDKSKTINSSDYFLEQSLCHETSVVAWNKLYKKEIFKDLRYEEGKVHEDEFIIHKIIFRCNKINILNKRLYYYRYREGSIKNNKNYNQLLDSFEAAINRYGFYISNNNNQAELLSSSDYLFKTYVNVEKHKDEITNKERLLVLKENANNLIKSSIDKLPKNKKLKMGVLIKNPIKAEIKYLKFLKLNSIRNKLKHPLVLLSYENCKRKIKHLKRDDVLIIGSPTYGNLGDQAIYLAMEKMIKDAGKKVIDVPYDYYYQGIKDRLPSSIQNTICLMGGGNLGNIYPNEEKIRRDVISKYKDSKIIIFPQTIDFSNDEEGQFELSLTKEIYSKHPNLHIFARENKSLGIIQKEFKKNNVYFAPDTVLYFERRKTNNYKNYILEIKRNDSEKLENDTKIENLEKELQLPVKKISTSSTKTIQRWERRKEVNKIRKEIRKSSVMITDRLHGLIFAHLENKQVFVFDNSNGKVLGVNSYINKVTKQNFLKFKELLK